MTIAAMELDGRLSSESEAVVALARGLAHALDERPFDDALYREYRHALAALALVGAERAADDDTPDFVQSIRTPPVRPPMGDPPD